MFARCRHGWDSISFSKIRELSFCNLNRLQAGNCVTICVIWWAYSLSEKKSACWAAVQVETAEVQLDVIEEGIDELCNLEKYLSRTHPPYESAELLAVWNFFICSSHQPYQYKGLPELNKSTAQADKWAC